MKCQAQLGRASKRSLLATGRLRGTRSRGSLLELRAERLGSASRQHCFSWETCPGRSAATSGHPSTSRSDVRRRLRSGPRRPQQTTFGQCNRCKGLARATTTLIEDKAIDALRGPLLVMKHVVVHVVIRGFETARTGPIGPSMSRIDLKPFENGLGARDRLNFGTVRR